MKTKQPYTGDFHALLDDRDRKELLTCIATCAHQTSRQGRKPSLVGAGCGRCGIVAAEFSNYVNIYIYIYTHSRQLAARGTQNLVLASGVSRCSQSILIANDGGR